MAQQPQMRCHGCKLHEFWLRAVWVLLKFWKGPATKWTWLGRDGPPGACFTAKHHSLVTYEGHGMAQQQHMRCHGCKLHEFWLRAVWVLGNFWQGPAKKWTWLCRDGPPGACFTSKHHSLVTYGGHGMVQQQQMRFHGCKLCGFWLRAGWVL